MVGAFANVSRFAMSKKVSYVAAGEVLVNLRNGVMFEENCMG